MLGNPASFALLMHACRDIEIIRHGGSYVDGLWVDSKEAPIIAAASVHPAKGKEFEAFIQTLPREEHCEEYLKVYTQDEIRHATEEHPADRIGIDGKTYKVLDSVYRPQGCFYKAYIGYRRERSNTIRNDA